MDVRSVEMVVAAEGVALVVGLSVPVPSVPVLGADGLLVSPLVALVTPEVTPTDVAPSVDTVVCPLTDASVDVVAEPLVTPDATPVAASELWDAVTATDVRSAPVTCVGVLPAESLATKEFASEAIIDGDELPVKPLVSANR